MTTWNVDTVHTHIGFSVRHLMVSTVRGQFKSYTGKVAIDPVDFTKTTIEGEVEVQSIDTGNTQRDGHLRTNDFFDAEHHPSITFKSRSVKQTGAQSGDIMGDLTMHGVTKPITLHVKLMSPLSSDAKQTRWAVTTEPLKRRDFGLLFGSTAEAISGISQTVAINIEIEATRAE